MCFKTCVGWIRKVWILGLVAIFVINLLKTGTHDRASVWYVTVIANRLCHWLVVSLLFHQYSLGFDIVFLRKLPLSLDLYNFFIRFIKIKMSTVIVILKFLPFKQFLHRCLELLFLLQEIVTSVNEALVLTVVETFISSFLTNVCDILSQVSRA